ncbi:MAG TPA: NAD(P)H-hydrate dehydratase [Chitinophagaceae bacterium]|nr:NAD(P)H-hydrate dehydratase [Chitinophagaceae bacterium]
MKIFSAPQIRRIDALTMEREPISSLDLMERAAGVCTSWICSRFDTGVKTFVFCGPGNNGGDGLAIARMLRFRGYPVEVWMPGISGHLSADCQANLDRLPPEILHRAKDDSQLPLPQKGDLVLDALFGTGLTQPPSGLAARAIEQINQCGATVVSVDIPSGMFPDRHPGQHPVVRADHTLSLETWKISFLMPGTGDWAGSVHILPLGLDPKALQEIPTPFYLTGPEDISRLLAPRPLFSHKGNFGHVLLLCGSYGKMGAAVLAARACLRSGAGLVTCMVPEKGYAVIQTAVPEAMCITYVPGQENFLSPEELEKYTAIGIGPGLGESPEAARLVHLVLENSRPLVIDADGLNLVARHPEWMKDIPQGSILTPHPGEFERLFGKAPDPFARLELLQRQSVQHRLHILLKGRYTAIACPDGRCFFNPTGNPGMATGGTGDALTGILSGLLAQGYSPEHATILGVYLHGLAGDFAAASLSEPSMLASDLIENLGEAFKSFNN